MKKIIVFMWLSLTTITLYGQEAYLNLERKIEDWMTSTKQEVVIPINESHKTIEFPNYGYSITGYFKKGVIQEGSWITISDNKNNYKLSGVVLSWSRVKGVIEESNGICTYGIFKVSNYPEENIISRIKYAKELQIRNEQIEYYKGYYNDCPTILSMNPTCLAIDGKTSGRTYIGFYSPLDREDVELIGYKNLKELILTVNENCCIQKDYDYQHRFLGTVKPILRESGYISFRHLEGDEINNPETPETKISVKRMGDVVKMLRIYRPNNIVISEELIVPANLISEENIRNIKFYYQNASEIYRVHKDSSRYKGQFKVDIVDIDDKSFTSKITYTYGTYTFGNGDVFKGNLSGRYYAGIPIDGIMTFNDGKKADGTWIQEYELTQSQLDKLQKEYKYPTAIRDAAKKMEYSNKYIKYGHKNPEAQASICFFCPDNEHIMLRWPEYILYDKQTELYICKHKESPNATFVEFKTDKKGNHIMEIIYDNYDFKNSTKSVPKYINILTWYPNDEIKSIRTYHYSSEQLYLALNFFSDGTLKNAYLYGVGYDDKLVLRKSKESHPTLGGYTSRLYDLFGDYEKSISWSIGDVTWLLSVRKFDITDFKQVDF